MTRDEFFDALDNLPKYMTVEIRKWLYQGPYEGKFCPITAVCKAKKQKNFTATNYLKAAKELGLNEKVANQIVKAADDLGNYYDYECNTRRYRKRLLRAVRYDK